MIFILLIALLRQKIIFKFIKKVYIYFYYFLDIF